MIQSILSGEYLVLARDCYAWAVHPVTGRDYEEGTLVAGTRVRNVISGYQETSFEASTDGGETWYLQRTTEDPKDLTKWAGKLSVSHHDDETGEEVR